MWNRLKGRSLVYNYKILLSPYSEVFYLLLFAGFLFYSMKENNKIIEAYTIGYRVTETGEVIGRRGKALKCYNNKGYYTFAIRVFGVHKTIRVHRLQAYQKYGDSMFKKETVVRHKNGNSLDNSYSNILIGTHSENMMDKTQEQRILQASNPIYKHKEILEDRDKNKMTYKELMLKYNISSKGTVSFIINKSLARADL